MGVEENDDKPINLLEVQPEIPEQEPIEQVFSQEPEDIRPIELSTELEDQQRFEETAKFEDIDTPKVEPKPEQKQARKSKIKRKNAARGANEDKPISKLHDELKKHSDARKKAEHEILDIKKGTKMKMQQKEPPNNSTRYNNNILHVLLKTSNIKNITTIIHARITNKIVSGQDCDNSWIC
jgi:hypothetical protein